MFSRADAEVVKTLFDKAVGDFRVKGKLAGQGLVAGTKWAAFLANEQAGGNPGLAPSGIDFWAAAYHRMECRARGLGWQRVHLGLEAARRQGELAAI